MRFSKPYADRVARLRVPLGFALAAGLLWLADPTPRSLALGLPPAAAGMALRAWAAGHLLKNVRLAVAGPYAHTRNPLYLGTLLVAAGFAVVARSPAWAALVAAFFSLVYLPAVQLEQQHLRNLFPEYPDYAARVPAFLPRLRASQKKSNPFRWALYLRNKEYEALAGFVAGMLWLIWKSLT